MTVGLRSRVDTFNTCDFTHLQFRWEAPEAELTLLTSSHYGLLVICDHDSRDAVGRSFSSPEGHSLQSAPHVEWIPDMEKLKGEKRTWLSSLKLGKCTSVIPVMESRGRSFGASPRLASAIEWVPDRLYLTTCDGSHGGHFLQSQIHTCSMIQPFHSMSYSTGEKKCVCLWEDCYVYNLTHNS